MEDSNESSEDVATKEGKSNFSSKTVPILWACGVMLTSSVILCTLYYFQLEQLSQAMNSVKTIRSSLIIHNQTFEEMNDTAILTVAIEFVEELEFCQKEMEDIEKAMKLIKEMKQIGWKSYKGHLYYISELTMIFSEAINECEDLGSILAPIHDKDTEDFAEFMSRLSRTGAWIGLQKKNNKWTWIHNNSALTTSFWKPGAPSRTNICVGIEKPCADGGKCWNNIPCHHTKHALCRLGANPNWIP